MTLDKEAAAGTTGEIVEGLLQRRTGRVLRIDKSGARVVADDLKMANGVVLSPDGRTLYVAEMVGRALVSYDRDPTTDALTFLQRVPLPAAPDNLTVDDQGRVWIAAHPKLLTLATGYQYREDRQSPSQVLVYHPKKNALRSVLTSNGREISAGSVALAAGRTIMIGSAFGPHILHCPLSAV